MNHIDEIRHRNLSIEIQQPYKERSELTIILRIQSVICREKIEQNTNLICSKLSD